MAEEQIGAASVPISADTTPILQEMEAMRKQVESQINALGVSMAGGAFLAVRGVQIAFHGLVDAVKAPFALIGSTISAVFGPAMDAVSHSLLDIQHWTAAARDAEVAQARFNAVVAASGDVIGYTAKELANMQQYLSNRGGGMFAGGAIRQAQQELIQLRDVRGENFFRALEISEDLANRSGKGLAETAASIGRALVQPEHGMRRLREEGILFTDTEKRLIETAGAGGDVFKQQAAMLDILAGKVGNISETMAGTASAKIAKLGNAWAGLGKQIWDFLVPVQGAVAEIGAAIVSTFSQTITPMFKDFTATTKGWADSVSGFLKENQETFRLWAALGKTIIGNAAQFISDALAKLFPSFESSTAKDFWDKIQGAATKFLGTVAVLSENFSRFWEAVKIEGQILWNSVYEASLPIWEKIANALYDAMTKAWDRTLNAFKSAMVQSDWFTGLMYIEKISRGQVFPGATDFYIKQMTGGGTGGTGAFVGPPDTTASDALNARRNELIKALSEGVKQGIADTSRPAFAGRTGSTVYDSKGTPGGIVGIEALSRSIQESILQTDFDRQTADNTARTAEATERIAGILGSGIGLAGGIGQAAAAATFAAP